MSREKIQTPISFLYPGNYCTFTIFKITRRLNLSSQVVIVCIGLFRFLGKRIKYLAREDLHVKDIGFMGGAGTWVDVKELLSQRFS